MSKHLLHNKAQHKVVDNNLISKFEQVITSEYLEQIELIRKLQSAKGKIGDFLHVARVPRAIHDQWVREGFDPTTANEDDYDALLGRLREIVKRLKADGQDRFILTDKTF